MPTYLVTTPEGQKYKITAPDDAAAQAAIATIAPAAATQAPTGGYGDNPRQSREVIEPEAPELRREIEVAKRMRGPSAPASGLADRFMTGATLGLKPEVEAAASGIGSLIAGRGYSEGYEIEKEANKRLEAEAAAKSPILSSAAEIAGGVVGGAPRYALRAPLALGSSLKERAARLGAESWEGAKNAATVGAISGAAEGEGLEGRLTGAATGAAIGGLIGGAAPPLLSGLGAAARPITAPVRALINPEREGAERLATALARDEATAARIGVRSGLDDVKYNQAVAEGQPLMAADRGGEATQGLLRSATNTSPEARQTIDSLTKERFLGQTSRMDDVLASQSSLNAPASDIVDMAKEAAKTANKPAYKAAYEIGDRDIWNPALERLTQSPAMEKALKSALRKQADSDIVDGFGGLNARVKLDEADQLVFTGEGGVPSYPSLRLWDLTKRELDSMGKQAARAGSDDARIYSGLSNQLRTVLDNIPEVGPAYKNARATAAKFFGEADAFSAGQTYAAKAKDYKTPEALKAKAKMSSEEQELFREGYIAAERARLKEFRDGRDATLGFMESPAARERAEVALGKEGATKFAAQLEIEAAMMATRKALGNSSTARQMVEMGAAGGVANSVWTGDYSLRGFGTGAALGGAAKYGKMKIDTRLAQRVGDMLASKDPKAIQRLITLSAKYPSYRDAVKAVRMAMMAKIAAEANPNDPSSKTK